MRDCGFNARLALHLNSVINVKAIVAAFNQEKVLVGAFSVIVKPDGSFALLVWMVYSINIRV